MSAYRLIDEEKDRLAVSRMCRTLGVSRSGYYAWKASLVSDRAIADAVLTEQIRAVFVDSAETYGSPRVHAELRLGRGIAVSRKRVERLMRQARLVAVTARKRRSLTRRCAEHPLAPDLVARDFAVAAPDELWVADFTQITTWQGTAYVAVVVDAYSRRCLGWSVRADKTAELVIDALEMAVWRRGQMRAQGAIHHSDQGSQYTSWAFSRRLVEQGITPSIGSVGDALDNAICESVIPTLKREKLSRETYRSIDDVQSAVFDWIETWYNRRRRHTSLGMLSPLEYEAQHYHGHTVTNP